MDLKEEILQGFADLNINCSMFECYYEGDRYSYTTIPKEILVDNYTVRAELTEVLRWDGFNECRFDELQVSFLEIINGSGKEIDTEFITNEEILNAINY